MANNMYDPFQGFAESDDDFDRMIHDFTTGGLADDGMLEPEAPTDEMLADMQVHRLYDMMNLNVEGIDFAHSCKKTLDAYTALSDAVNCYTEVYDTYGEFPAIDGDTKRRDATLQKFAETLSEADVYQVFDSFSDVQAKTNMLLQNDVKSLQDICSDSIDRVKEGIQTAHEHPESMNFDEIIPMRVDFDEPITKADIDLINRRIQLEADGLATDIEHWRSRAALHLEDACNLTYVKDTYGNLTEQTIPDDLPDFYAVLVKNMDEQTVEDEISQHMLHHQQLSTRVSQVESEGTAHLFERVYETSDYCRSHEVPDHLLPVNARGEHENPNVLSEKTRELLGKEYEAFEAMKFEESLQGFRERNVSKGLMGIDVSKTAKDVVKMQEREVEAVVSKETAAKMQEMPASKPIQDRTASQFDSIVKAGERQAYADKGLGEA